MQTSPKRRRGGLTHAGVHIQWIALNKGHAQTPRQVDLVQIPTRDQFLGRANPIDVGVIRLARCNFDARWLTGNRETVAPDGPFSQALEQVAEERRCDADSKNSTFEMIDDDDRWVSQPTGTLHKRLRACVRTHPSGTFEVPKGVVRKDADPSRDMTKGAGQSWRRVAFVWIERMTFPIRIARDKRVPRERTGRAIRRVQQGQTIRAGSLQMSGNGEWIRGDCELTTYEHGACC